MRQRGYILILIGYEVGELNWRHEINQQNDRLWGLRSYFLDSFSLFSFPFSTLTVKAVPLPSNSRYKNLQGSSFEHDVDLHDVDVRVFSIAFEWIVLEFGSFREISDGLKKSPGILPCMTFIESTSQWTSSPFKRFAYSFNIYAKKKHSLPSSGTYRETCGN